MKESRGRKRRIEEGKEGVSGVMEAVKWAGT